MTPEKQVLSEIPSVVGYGYFLEPDNIGWVAYVLKAGSKFWTFSSKVVFKAE